MKANEVPEATKLIFPRIFSPTAQWFAVEPLNQSMALLKAKITKMYLIPEIAVAISGIWSPYSFIRKS